MGLGLPGAPWRISRLGARLPAPVSTASGSLDAPAPWPTKNEDFSTPTNRYNKGQAIVDSGSTGITLPDPAYSDLKTQIAALNLPQYDNMFGSSYCYQMASDDLSKYPYLNFVLFGSARAIRSTAPLLPRYCPLPVARS